MSAVLRPPEIPVSSTTLAAEIARLQGPFNPADLAEILRRLVDHGLSELPLPGAGDTLTRWRRLGEIAAKDLSLAKVAEGHTDAVAILAELRGPALPPRATCGVWAAESGTERVEVTRIKGRPHLRGRKHWCSGARFLSHALLTVRDGEAPMLALVSLLQAGVTVTAEGWTSVGMAATGSVDVLFDLAPAVLIGGPAAYLERPGFWQGGAGIAACWHGAALALAEALRAGVARRPTPHGLAHLGELDALLDGLQAQFTQAAAWMDAHPRADAERLALRLRTAAELAARRVMDLCTRILGAAAYCKSPDLAQRLADLPVFLSQSHAERDWSRLGELAAASPADAWRL